MNTQADTSQPAWAAHLPSKCDLDYVRSLLGALFMVSFLAWVLLAILCRGPGILTRLGRTRVGL